MSIGELLISHDVHNAHYSVKSKRTPKLCFLHVMENDTRPSEAKRLEQARKSRGFKSAKDAARYFGWNYESYAQHENGNRGITRVAEKYAKALRVSPGWLLTGEGNGPADRPTNTIQARRVTVKGYVQAGHWAETWELPEDEQYDVPVPLDDSLSAYPLYGAETRGPSMNRRYPEGTVVVFTHAIETGEDITPGGRYVVERQGADGLREATVKQLWADDTGKMWLLPESSDPRFQEPLAIDGGDEDTIRVIGKVRYSVSRE